jgi:anti-anti-sigma factor
MLGVIADNCGNAVIFRCSGRIVAGEEPWKLYNNVIAQQSKRLIVLDLTGVNRIDAGGLGVLLSLRRWARGEGVRLQLIPSEAVQELLDMTRLGSQFEIRSSVSAPRLPADSREDSAVVSRPTTDEG